MDVLKELAKWLISGHHVGVFAPTGYGKTLTLAWFAYWMSRNGYPIYSNMASLNEKYIKYQLLETPEDLRYIGSGFVLIDEPADWGFDSYYVRSYMNRLTQDIAKRARKRRQSFWIAEQRDMRVDPNLYYNIDYIIIPEANEDLDVIEIDVFHRILEEWIDSFNIPLSATLKLVDTEEVIPNIYDDLRQGIKLRPEYYKRYLLRPAEQPV